MTKPHPTRCMRCKLALTTVVYVSPEIDPLQAMPLCHVCAILACFRVGRVGKKQ